MSHRFLQNTTTYSLFEVMEYGSIVAKDEDLQIILTINGAYYNGFMYVGGGLWISVNDIWAPSWSNSAKSKGLYTDDNSVRLINIQDEAEQILQRIRDKVNEELRDEDIEAIIDEI